MKIKLFILSTYISLSNLFLSQQKDNIDKYHRVKREHIELEPDYFGIFLSYLIPVGAPLLWFIAIVMILKTEFKSPTDKLIWVLISFVPLLGPLLFFLIGRKQIKEY